jgi:cysteine desulfurase / selenocysteine lyase
LDTKISSSQPLSAAEVAQIRRQAPGSDHITHLNYAGSGLISRATLKAMTEHLQLEANIGAMEAGAMTAHVIGEARLLTARLIGAKPTEIAFCASGSAAWGTAFSALPSFNKDDRILVSRQEWGSNLSTIRLAAAKTGASVETMPARDDGTVDCEKLQLMIDNRVRLIAATWLPANGGLINDVKNIGTIANIAQIPYFVDAGQAFGQLPIDVGEIGCDVLKSAGRKHIRGPRGTAILFTRKQFLQRYAPVFVDVQSAPLNAQDWPSPRSDASRFEMQEISMAAMHGLCNALQEALALSVERTWPQVKKIASFAREQLARLGNVTLLDIGLNKSGLVSFNVKGLSATEVKSKLALKKINIGANGVAYTPLDMRARGLTEVARISVSYLTTEHEIETAVQAIRQL